MTRPRFCAAAHLAPSTALLPAVLALASLSACSEDSGPPEPATESGSSALQRTLLPTDDERDAVLFGEALPPVTDWLADNIERRDAGFDGWTSEVLHDLAKNALHEFLEAVLHPDSHSLEGIVTDDFRTTAWAPETLETALDGTGIRIRRGEPGGPNGGLEHGASDLPALIEFLGSTSEATEQHKIISVERDTETSFTTRALVQVEVRDEDGRAQHNLTLDLAWSLQASEQEQHAALASLSLVAYEEARFDERALVDVTEPVFGSLAAWQDELRLGIDHYHLATDKLVGQSFLGMQGISVGDVTGDGLDDVFVCQQAGLPNRLLVRMADGSLEDRSNKANLAVIDRTRSALILDFDGDGQRDIALAVGPLLMVLYNQGGGIFPDPQEYVVLPSPDESEIYGLNAADVDSDGDLDVYVMRYGVGGVTGSVPTPYHDARNGSSNVLWRNDGDRQWTDATTELGLDDGNDRYSLASVFEDFDADGDLDLYVTNDFGRNNYYEFENGRFRDVADEAGASDQAAGMGATVADIDLDGDADVLVSNMFSSAGLRIASQSDRYMGGQHEDLHDDYVYHARGNTLLTNNGDGTFEDATEGAGVALGRWAWGASFFDLNGDGLEDIYIPNGFVTNRDQDDL